jgi:flagellar biosynthesis protein FliQ
VTLGYRVYPVFVNQIFTKSYNIKTIENASLIQTFYPIYVNLPTLPLLLSMILGLLIGVFVRREMTQEICYKYFFKIKKIIYNRDYTLNECIKGKVASSGLTLSYEVSYKGIDRGFLELFGPGGLWQAVNLFYNSKLTQLHNGSIFNYLRLNFRVILSTLGVIGLVIIIFFETGGM